MHSVRRIGDLQLSGRAILAPTCGVLNMPMRAAFRRCGAALSVVGALDAAAIAESPSSDLVNLLGRPEEVCDAERPVSLQLLASAPEVMAEAAARVEPMADIIDLNFSGPLKEVLDADLGAALLDRPRRIADITAATVDRVDVPVTVKIRLGIERRDADVVGIARMCEQAGAAAVTIHARAADDGYTGAAYWPAIGAVKKAVSIPVIGNGAVHTPADAKAMVDHTGCDFVMVCTAAFIDPMIFRKIDVALGVADAPRLPQGPRWLGFMCEYYRQVRRLQRKSRSRAIKQAFRQFAAVRRYMIDLQAGRVGFGSIEPQPWPRGASARLSMGARTA